MASPSNPINTRADLDALAGTPAHAAFMAALAGTIWRLEKDDDAGLWRAAQDNSTIERFGFVPADFADALPPELPQYTPPPSKVPTVITMRQARLALLGAGLLDTVNAGISAMPQAAQIEWEYAQEVRRDNALISTLAANLGLDSAAVDMLFTAGAAL
jgi:hypothetical protein